MRTKVSVQPQGSGGGNLLETIATLAALAVAIVALVLTVVQADSTGGALSNVRTSEAALTANDTGTTEQLVLLQSQWVEAMMGSGNETVLQEGTFTWQVGNRGEGSDGYPGVECFNKIVGGYSMIAGGSGYRVGDLVTNGYTSPATYYGSYVLRVDAVNDTTGAVTAFTTLSVGCFVSDSGSNSTLPTLSVVGSGMTVKRWATVYPGNPYPDWYDNYHPPMNGQQAPLQQANYTLKRVTIGTNAYTVLVLEGPEFPMAIRDGSITKLHFVVYQFQPFIPEVLALGNWGYIFPLTQRNLAALNLHEYDGTCLRTQNPSVCFLDGKSDFTTPMSLNSMKLSYSWYNGTGLNFDTWLSWVYASQGSVHNYALNGTTFSLRAPLMLVLPSL